LDNQVYGTATLYSLTSFCRQEVLFSFWKNISFMNTPILLDNQVYGTATLYSLTSFFRQEVFFSFQKNISYVNTPILLRMHLDNNILLALWEFVDVYEILFSGSNGVKGFTNSTPHCGTSCSVLPRD